MKRRERFVITTFLLSGAFWLLQLLPLPDRYLGIAGLVFGSYVLSAWALREDLQWLEAVTILPLPAFYTLAVSWFYLLLPSALLARIIVVGLFGVGMYALLLTGNIFSVAKGRGIQLIHAAQAIGLQLTIITSVLLTQTIFVQAWPWWISVIVLMLSHAWLIFMSLWSINLELKLDREVVVATLALTWIIGQTSLVLIFLPLFVWYRALLLMSVLYMGLSATHNYLQNKLFSQTLLEYATVAGIVTMIFIMIFPGK